MNLVNKILLEGSQSTQNLIHIVDQQDGSQHLIVYNNKAINIIKVENLLNESVKFANKILNQVKLNEIGDSSSTSFKFKSVDQSDVYAKYEFQTTADIKYKVVLVNDKLDNKNADNNWILSFGNIKSVYGFNAMSMDSVVNKGEVYKVMATVINIVKDFIKKNKNNIDAIIFKGTDDRRDHLYKKYISYSLGNNWKETTDKDENFIIIPVKQKQPVLENKKKLNEIGDAKANAFSFNLIQDSKIELKYEFTTNAKVLYNVEFVNLQLTKKEKEFWEVTFGNIQDNKMNISVSVNKGELFQVMATVMEILKNFMKNHKHQINQLRFLPTDKRREHLYIQYVKNMVKDEWKYYKNSGGEIVLYPTS